MPGELLVKFKQPRSSSQMLGKASRYKARLKSAFTNIGVEHWVLNDSVDLAQTIESLKNDPDVLIVEPNYRRYPRAIRPQVSEQNQQRLDEINLPALWSVPQTEYRKAHKVRVAVIDDAFDIAHVDLANNIIAPFDAFAKDDNPAPEVCVESEGGSRSSEAHGTQVLGVVGAVAGNAEGIDGAADNALMIPVRVSCNYTVAAEVRAFGHAIAEKADIINISWGGPQFSEIERLGIVALLKENILIVTAAGNNETDNDRVLDYPSGLDLPNILSVAAVSPKQTLTDWSQYGQTTVDIAAPGDFIATLAVNNGYTNNVRGTSFSAPFVAGVAASLLARSEKDTSVLAIKAAILASATPFSDNLRGRIVTDGYVDAFAAYKAMLEPEPLPVISQIEIDDSGTKGNSNGEVDANEQTILAITIENIGVSANFITAELSSRTLGEGFLATDRVDKLVGFKQSDFQYDRAVLYFPVDFNAYYQTQHVEFALKLTSFFDGEKTNQTEHTRYFSVDTGSLVPGSTIQNVFQRETNKQDEFHYYYVTLDEPQRELAIRLTADDPSVDMDLLVKYGHSPQFSYEDYKNDTLDDGERFEVGTLRGVENNGTESVTIREPEKGTYHIVVIADRKQAKNKAYRLSAETSRKSAGGCHMGSADAFDPVLYCLLLLASWRVFRSRNELVLTGPKKLLQVAKVTGRMK